MIMKKNVKVSVMLEYELRFFNIFLNDFVSKKNYSDVVVTDSLVIDTDNCDTSYVNESCFLNRFCYELYKNNSTRFSNAFLDNDASYGSLKFSVACEFISVFRNSMSCNFHTFEDGKFVDSDVISATVYNCSLQKEYKSQLQVTAHVKFESYDID